MVDLPLYWLLFRSRLVLTSGEMWPAAVRSRRKPRAGLYSSVSMSFVSLPPSKRQLLGARKMPWKNHIAYGPAVLSLVMPIAQRLACGLVKALHKRLKSSAVLSGPTPAASTRFCWTNMTGPVSERTTGMPAMPLFLTAMRHEAVG